MQQVASDKGRVAAMRLVHPAAVVAEDVEFAVYEAAISALPRANARARGADDLNFENSPRTKFANQLQTSTDKTAIAKGKNKL
jgi:hypothetical protein